ncbi:MAG: endo alpha-1,4 polygalactosaminidase [Saccharofermentanales bacterium]
MTKSEAFFTAENYSVYYGTECLKDLIQFDIAIIDFSDSYVETVRALQAKGVLVFAYLSVIEMHPERDGFHLHESQLLKVDGELFQNHEYHTYLADIRNPEWAAFIYGRAQTYLTEYGCDGLFLDTVGDLEDNRIPVNIKYDLIAATVALLEKIKENLNQPLLIQNNGLGLLLNYTKNCVDGICWENPGIGHRITGKFNKVIMKKLKDIQTGNGMKIFLLTEESKYKNRIKKFAKKNDYLYYDAPKDYTRI